jgi:hypothetical protein
MTIPSASNNSVELDYGIKPIPSTKTTESQANGKDEQTPNIDIIDIRHDEVQINLKQEISQLLKPPKGPKTLPTLLLYDERGLQLFEKARPLNLSISALLTIL